MLPNFFILGAPRCGTTMLYEQLRRHPQIFMSPVKEPFFFFPGEDRYVFPDGRAVLGMQSQEDYQALFAGGRRSKAVGEASTLYLYSSKAPARIRRDVPDAKLIAVLRSPVDRAYSHFLFHRMQGFEPIERFSEALAAEGARIQNAWFPFWYYREVGRYAGQIRRYYNTFARDQIQFFLLEDFQTCPAVAFHSMYQFLGVDADARMRTALRVNRSGTPKSGLLNSLLTKPNGLKNLFKRVLPASLLNSLSRRMMNWNLSAPTMDQETRRVLQDFYREDILETQELIQRDLSAWLCIPPDP
jgi:hypothetical protein